MPPVVRLENEPSNRVLERLGFRREGVKRRLLRYRCDWADATLFARLVDD
jgi:ribosomal-protein-alanine N-acetyltransferase